MVNLGGAAAVLLTSPEGPADPPSVVLAQSFAMIDSVEQIKGRIEAAVPGAKVEILANASPSQQHSLLLDHEHAREIAMFLRDDAALRLDFCSNATGVDWLERTVKTTVKTKQVVDGVEKEVVQTTEEKIPGYLEAVYHLFSIALKQGPVIIRMRTADRAVGAPLPSLTPVWRSAEMQEREIYDLYGIRFEGHPDLRRILMWDEFTDHPMRKDYVAPDDFEWEPTPHDEVLVRAKQHYPARPAVDGAEEITATDEHG
jgi:NADH-quinone oxidoreductase subunit C